MSTHSIAEAQTCLPELIDRALKGEAVTITREGGDVLEIVSAKAALRARRLRELA